MKVLHRLSDEHIRVLVSNSGIVKLQNFDDYPDGNLFICEDKKDIHFQIKRVYYVNELYRLGAIRGKHAHKKLKQVIFCINGSFDLLLDDGTHSQTILMDTAKSGIILGPYLWHEMTNFSTDCVLLILASDYFKESDYIRDYQVFLQSVNPVPAT